VSISTKSRFHQHFTCSFYERRSQKSKKDWQLECIFLRFGICTCKKLLVKYWWNWSQISLLFFVVLFYSDKSLFIWGQTLINSVSYNKCDKMSSRKSKKKTNLNYFFGGIKCLVFLICFVLFICLVTVSIKFHGFKLTLDTLKIALVRLIK